MKKILPILLLLSGLSLAKSKDPEHAKHHHAEHMVVDNYPSGHMLQVSSQAANITLEQLSDLLKQISKHAKPDKDYMPHLTAASVAINENLRESLDFATELLASIDSANNMKK